MSNRTQSGLVEFEPFTAIDHIGSDIEKLNMSILSFTFDVGYIKGYEEGVKEEPVKKITFPTSYIPDWNAHEVDSKDMRT